VFARAILKKASEKWALLFMSQAVKCLFNGFIT
jgi:hypothetical protein